MEKTQLKKDLKISTPNISNSAFVAKGAKVIGSVTLKNHSLFGIIAFFVQILIQ